MGRQREHAPTIGRRAAVSIALQDQDAEATWATELQHDAEGIPRTIEGSAYRHVLRHPMSDFKREQTLKKDSNTIFTVFLDELRYAASLARRRLPGSRKSTRGSETLEALLDPGRPSRIYFP